MFKITLQMFPLDGGLQYIENLSRPEILKMETDRITEEIAVKIYNDIMIDPDIPKEIKDALAVVKLDDDSIAVTCVWDLELLYEKGTETGWRIYRCPKLKYAGGTIKKGFEGRSYLNTLWKDLKVRYANELNFNIMDAIERWGNGLI